MFIYDEHGNYITRTIITGFHKTEMTVSISKDVKEIERGTQLIIMIVHPDGASEYDGIAREGFHNTREISLYKGRHRNGRTTSRFLINTPAIIKSVTIDANKVTLSVPQNVHVVNISKTGALIQSSIKCFNVGTILEIIMTVNERDTILNAQVKREAPNEDGTFYYGCRFIYKTR